MDTREHDGFDDLPILADLRGLLAEHMRAGPAKGASAAPRRRGPGWAAAGLRHASLALAVAVALAVVVVGLVALHHRSTGSNPASPAGHRPTHPPVSPPPTRGEQLADQAQRQVQHRDHACSPPVNQGDTLDRGSPGHALLSLLGVLRRPPLPADPTNKVIARLGWDAGAGVYVNYIRRARTEYGRSYWIVPEARTTPFGPIPARCYREFHATLVHDLRHASPTLRAQALRAQYSQLKVMNAQSEHRAGLCFIAIGLRVRPRPGAVGFGCSPGTDGLIPPQGGNGSGDHEGGTILSGMVLDGVASVTVHYDASGTYPAHTITSRVVNNVYVLKVPADTAHQPFPTSWQVRMADGRVLTPHQLQDTLGMPHGGG